MEQMADSDRTRKRPRLYKPGILLVPRANEQFLPIEEVIRTAQDHFGFVVTDGSPAMQYLSEKFLNQCPEPTQEAADQ